MLSPGRIKHFKDNRSSCPQHHSFGFYRSRHHVIITTAVVPKFPKLRKAKISQE